MGWAAGAPTGNEVAPAFLHDHPRQSGRRRASRQIKRENIFLISPAPAAAAAAEGRWID